MSDSTESTPEARPEYSAKQVATKLGIDAKTMRKFFRSPASTVTPVGFGGRYSILAEDMPRVEEEFTKWKQNKAPKGRRPSKSAPRNARSIVDLEETEISFDEFEEPTDEELMALDDEFFDSFEDNSFDEEDYDN